MVTIYLASEHSYFMTFNSCVSLDVPYRAVLREAIKGTLFITLLQY